MFFLVDFMMAKLVDFSWFTVGFMVGYIHSRVNHPSNITGRNHLVPIFNIYIYYTVIEI